MKEWYRFQTLVIAAGTAFAWYTVLRDFARFFDLNGTVFKIKDCVVMPNPVTTPCFWGAIGFLIALVWSIKIARKSDEQNKLKQEKYLTWFLIGGTIFGWSNVAILIQRFLASHGKPTIGCSGQIMTSPFTTPCFYGSSFYLLALIVALLTLWLHRSRITKKTDYGSTSS